LTTIGGKIEYALRIHVVVATGYDSLLPPLRVPLNAVNGPVLVHYLVVLTGLRTS